MNKNEIPGGRRSTQGFILTHTPKGRLSSRFSAHGFLISASEVPCCGQLSLRLRYQWCGTCFWNLQQSLGSLSIDLSSPSDWELSLAIQRSSTNVPLVTIDKAHGHVVFENNSEALRGCAGRTVISISRSVVYPAGLSVRSYHSPGEKSIFATSFSNF